MPGDSSSVHRRACRSATLVARGATLDGFAADAGSGPGVQLRELAPLTSLIIHTRNSRYHLVISHGADVIIQGGSFFPQPTAVRLDGSSLGSSFLKIGWVGVGMRMEICAGGQRIVTSAVRSITRDERADTGRPH